MDLAQRTIWGIENILKAKFHPEMKETLIKQLIDNYGIIQERKKKTKSATFEEKHIVIGGSGHRDIDRR